MSKDERLSSLYFDVAQPGAFSSIDNLYKQAQNKKWSDINRKDVTRFLHKTRVEFILYTNSIEKGKLDQYSRGV